MSNRPSAANVGWHQGQCGWSRFRLALLGGVAVAGWGADTAAQAQTGPNLILPDGRTRTQLSVAGTTTGITTGTVAGANAFNSFSQFKVGTGRTVNLVVPTGAQNLLNLVRDGQTVVDGTLNGMQGGRVGGNIFFADPYGFLVGPSGTINTGSLTVSTPTKAFIDRLLPSPNQPDANATAMLLADTMPVSPDGVVVVRGRINAQSKVKLRGSSVSVAAAAPDARKVFDASVNTAGIRRGGSIVVSNGEIDIVAEGAVEIAGELRADGAAGVVGGSISVASGGDTHVASTARLSARGVGVASRGGAIKFKAGHDLVVADGAAVNVSGGTTGDGGQLELSAMATASVGAFVLDAGSNGGAAGSLLIDPTDLVIGSAAGNTASMDTGGVAAKLIADHSITVDGYVNTRKTGHAGNDTTSASTGNSGNITLTAPTITVNGSLNAGVVGGGGFAAGTILLDAEAINTVSSGVATSNTSIVVNGRIVGGNVTLQSIATASASYNVLEKVLNSAVANGKFSGILLNALVAEANASVAVNANAVVVSSGSVVIAASGTQTASTGAPISIAPDPAKAGTGNNAGFAALYGSTTGVVSATVLGSVTAAGDLTVSAHDTAKIELNLKATSATSSGNSFGGVVGVAYANLATTANVGSGATVAAANLNVVARNDDSWSNTASVALLASGSGGAGSVAVNDISTGATAHLGASLAAGSVGNVLVEADSITALDLASSSSTIKQQAAGGGGGGTPDPDPIPTGTGGAGTAGVVTSLIGTGSASGARRQGPGRRVGLDRAGRRRLHPRDRAPDCHGQHRRRPGQVRPGGPRLGLRRGAVATGRRRRLGRGGVGADGAEECRRHGTHRPGGRHHGGAEPVVPDQHLQRLRGRGQHRLRHRRGRRRLAQHAAEQRDLRLRHQLLLADRHAGAAEGRRDARQAPEQLRVLAGHRHRQVDRRRRGRVRSHQHGVRDRRQRRHHRQHRVGQRRLEHGAGQRRGVRAGHPRQRGLGRAGQRQGDHADADRQHGRRRPAAPTPASPPAPAPAPTRAVPPAAASRTSRTTTPRWPKSAPAPRSPPPAPWWSTPTTATSCSA